MAISAASNGQRSMWQRLLLAQESGLVLVIALLMGLLTIFSGNKPQRDFIAADPDTSITESGGFISITSKGEQRSLAASDGWEVRGGPGSQSVQRTREVNKFLNLDNLMQVLVFASFIAIMAVGITAVIILGGIDLSIGSTYALAALTAAIALRYPWGGESFPSATIRGSTGLWWGALVLGGAALVASVVLRRVSRSRAATTGQAPQGVIAAMPGALLWAGVGLLVAVAWQLLGALHTTGRQVESGMIARSDLGMFASLGLGLAVCLVVGSFCGWLNGTMIVGLKVHPFIITLGTMAAYRGITALPTQAQSVANFPESFQGFIKHDFSGITPVPVVIMLLVCIAGVFVLSRTVLGRQIYAIGGNETAASYAGVPVAHVKRVVFTIMGALAGLSAFVYLGYFGGAEPAAGTSYELKAIAAAVIGGASLSGGRGSALGAVLGAILVQLIDNAMVMLEIDQSYNNVVLGGAIIAAVVLDQLKSRLVPVGK